MAGDSRQATMTQYGTLKFSIEDQKKMPEDFMEVTFSPSFDNDDVVVCVMCQGYEGPDTPGLRIKGVTKDGFFVRFDEIIINGKRQGHYHHIAETIGWIAVGNKLPSSPG